jgi:rRNA maturation endonuclease Nob1
MDNLHIFKSVQEVVKNPDNYEQCLYCKNPIDVRHKVDGCPTCGSHYFVPKEQKDFTHLTNELPPETEIEV